MGKRDCGRIAAALAMVILGVPSALAMERRDGGTGGEAAASSDGAASFAARPRPTSFDYVVLASLADAPGLLSLSSYHFRSGLGYGAIPRSGVLRVDLRRWICGDQGEVRGSMLVPDDVSAARDHDGRTRKQACRG
jgi:hypothetical protein